MKALWITADFHPQIGGLQTYALSTVAELSKFMDVVVVTGDGQHPPPDHDIAFHVCPDLGRPTVPERLAAVRRRLAEILERERPDVIHLANAGLAVYADELARVAPVAVSIHGNDLTAPWQIWPHGPVSPVIRAGLRHCVLGFAVSRHTARLVHEFGHALLVEVVPQGCDLATFRPRPIDAPAMRRALRLTRGGPVLLTCARLVGRKGHLTVLAALARIRTPVNWVVVGIGTRRNALALRLLGLPLGLVHRIRYLGRVDAERLVDLYNLCDVFVLVPTERRTATTVDSEGFGLVFHEAAACGKPAIASATGGCVEAVTDGETGLIVPEGSAATTADAIRRLLTDRALATALGTEARRRVEAAGGWAGTARTIHLAYLRMLDGSREGPAAAAQR